MGLLEATLAPLATYSSQHSTPFLIGVSIPLLVSLAILLNIASQILLPRDPSLPPLVFHLVPFIGSTVTYGIDPYAFFFNCRQKYGDVFTFVLLGKKTTVCLGTKGNDFILNGKLKDVNAEEIYSPLTTPVFGKDVVYDCPNAKLMEQKKFVKYGLTSNSLRSYVPLITAEVRAFFSPSASHKRFSSNSGTVDLPSAMAELTIYTASRSLQGREVREKFDAGFADLYHYLDMGFTPINFMLPWAPLPQNRRRDMAQRKMTETYMSIIKERREELAQSNKSPAEAMQDKEQDMIWNLMSCAYKTGQAIPDHEIAHMMIALLMAGQHSSSATISWILLRLASRPSIQSELLAEQHAVLGTNPTTGQPNELTHDDLANLPLHGQVVKETLRLHSPIHSIMRAVKSPMPVANSPYVIPTTHTLLAAPGLTSRTEDNFPEPLLWEPHRWDADMDEKSDYARLTPQSNPSTTAAEEEEKEDYGYGLVSKGTSSPYLPFGAGRHRCIGEQFAYVQLQTILVEVVRGFRLKNLGGEGGKGLKEGQVVDTDYSSLFSRPLGPAVVGWERREGKGEKE